MIVDQAELWRLRRFALGSGLVLFTWGLAGVKLGSQPQLTVLGLPFVVERADLIPFGLAAAACYAALRYFYYAVSFGPSPYRVRRDILDQFRGRQRHGKPGPFPTPGTYADRLTEISASPWRDSREHMEKLANDLRNSFPKFGLARVKAEVKGEASHTPDGESFVSYTVEASIPVRCRIAAILQDIDYTAPIWFPLLAIAYWYLRTP
jgi:hypothetical protein